MRFMPVDPCPRPFSFLVAKAVLAVAAMSLSTLPTAATADDGDDTVALFASTGSRAELSIDSTREFRLKPSDASSPKADRDHQEFRSGPIGNTILFVNGQLVAPPLVVTTEQNRVLVNDIELPIDDDFRQMLREAFSPEEGADSDFTEMMTDDELRQQRRSRRRREAGDADSKGDPGISTLKTAEVVAGWLDSGNSVIVMFSGQPQICLPITIGGLELLMALQTRGKDRESLDYVLTRLPSDVDSDLYLDWITGFKTSPILDELIVEKAAIISESESRNKSATAAVSRLRTMSYPMSVVGLLLSVFAFGHVVSNKPPSRFAPIASEFTPETREMVNRCLLLVVALSLLDLIWTVLASQANQMAELNPMGREFIQNPALLGAFKFVMTGIGVGLLFALKRHRIAQTAAWWACMILTLLTMRWLTFNSMFA